MGMFYLLYAFASVLLTGMTTFFYGIELGQRLQRYMFLAKCGGGLLALFFDMVLLRVFGFEILSFIIICINLGIFMGLDMLRQDF